MTEWSGCAGPSRDLGEKHEAEKDAKRIHAAELVDNELQVKPLSDRKDAELRGQVLQALALDEVVPPTVDAKVKDGVVTLTGIVKGQDQLDAAKLAAANVAGDLEVIDQMTLTLEPNAHEVRDAIAAALKRNALARAKSLSIKTSHGTVTVKGKVRSWEERDAAIEAVRSLEGVRRVADHITVESSADSSGEEVRGVLPAKRKGWRVSDEPEAPPLLDPHRFDLGATSAPSATARSPRSSGTSESSLCSGTPRSPSTPPTGHRSKRSPTMPPSSRVVGRRARFACVVRSSGSGRRT